jgi:ribosomal-protein-serine acetyltransferase
MSEPNPQPLLLDVPDHLITDRLLLRIPRAGDSRFVWPAVMESQAELAPWMPWAYPQASEQGTEEWCRRAAASFILRERFNFSLYLRETDTCVGSCGVPRLKWAVPSFEIGYWLRTSYCGQGLMAEAVGAVERMCFELFKAARVEIRCGAQNMRSRRVAERAGYAFEGTLRNEERAPTGELRDQCVYAKISTV